MKTKLLIIALALPLVFGCEKSETDGNGNNGGDNTEQGGNAGGYDPDKEDPMEDLPPLEDVDDICTKMDDIAFMAYCYENFDVNKDGKVSMTEANAVSSIECNTASSFTGIGYFTNLTSFKSSSVKSVNLGYNKKLVSINCSGSSLETIDLRYNTSVSEINFYYCKNLTKILMASDAPLKSVGEKCFSNCGLLSKVSLPKNLESIGEDAFWGCTCLTSLTLPDGLTSIDKAAFMYCSSLKSIEIPQNIRTLKSGTFYDCTSLENVTFAKNSNLKIIDVSWNILGHAAGVFENCTSLKSIVLPDGLTSIGVGAFRCCSSLKSIEIPQNIQTLESETFYNCTSLENVTFAENSNLEVIDDGGNFSNHTAGVFENCTSLKSIVLPDGLISIGSYAFCGCTGLTSLTFPESLTSIGESAFYGCTGLIKVDAFKCTALTFKSIVSISYDRQGFIYGTDIPVLINCREPAYLQFSGCSQLIEFSIGCRDSDGFAGYYYDSKATGEYGPFYGIAANAVLKVPYGTAGMYKNNWSRYFKTIVEIE